MPRHLLPVSLCILLLGAGIFGGAQVAEANKLRASLAALDKERADLRKQVWDLKKLNQGLANRPGRRSAPPASEDLAAANANPPPAGSPAAFTRGGRPEGGGFAEAMNNPEVQQLMAIQQKAGLDGRYATLFKKLNLSPAELEKFKSLLVEKQTALMDVMAAARNQGLGRESRDGIRQLVEETQAEVDQSIRSTLGDSAYNEYKNYETTLPQRAVVGQLAQRLSYSSTPLNETQTEQLVQILAANAPAPADNRAMAAPLVQTFAVGNARAGVATAFFGGAPISDTVITQSQSVLLPTQIAALQTLQQEQQAANQLAQQMRSLTRGGPQTTGAAGGTSPQPGTVNPAVTPR